MELKQCSKCGQQKSIESFYKTQGRTRSECKECTKLSSKTRHDELAASYPERIMQSSLCEKQCPKCGQIKSINAFAISRTRRDGHHAICKECARVSFNKWKKQNPERSHRLIRSAQLKHKYGVDIVWYESKLDEQGHRCAICGVAENIISGVVPKFSFAVDHDHETGAIRGLLCNTCNQALGLLKDSPALVRKAADYLDIYLNMKDDNE